MEKSDLMLKLKIDQEFAERQVRDEINNLRNTLDKLESRLNQNEVRADDGLQGNEWRLYKELSNLERINEFISELKKID